MLFVGGEIVMFGYDSLFSFFFRSLMERHIMWWLSLPSYMAVALFVLIPILVIGPIILVPWWIFVKRWRKANDRYQRWKTNHCIACNYDLRGHMPYQPGTKCPECGTLAPMQSKTELQS